MIIHASRNIRSRSVLVRQVRVSLEEHAVFADSVQPTNERVTIGVEMKPRARRLTFYQSCLAARGN
jgi:hypothetical protein